jgi:hypothetical protein|eukprot:SAG25_NODE_1093_length_4032_cov_2.343504_5_plen_174_part_00
MEARPQIPKRRPSRPPPSRPAPTVPARSAGLAHGLASPPPSVPVPEIQAVLAGPAVGDIFVEGCGSGSGSLRAAPDAAAVVAPGPEAAADAEVPLPCEVWPCEVGTSPATSQSAPEPEAAQSWTESHRSWNQRFSDDYLVDFGSIYQPLQLRLEQSSPWAARDPDAELDIGHT